MNVEHALQWLVASVWATFLCVLLFGREPFKSAFIDGLMLMPLWRLIGRLMSRR